MEIVRSFYKVGTRYYDHCNYWWTNWANSPNLVEIIPFTPISPGQTDEKWVTVREVDTKCRVYNAQKRFLKEVWKKN